jgi:hypothetical protein
MSSNLIAVNPLPPIPPSAEEINMAAIAATTPAPTQSAELLAQITSLETRIKKYSSVLHYLAVFSVMVALLLGGYYYYSYDKK